MFPTTPAFAASTVYTRITYLHSSTCSPFVGQSNIPTRNIYQRKFSPNSGRRISTMHISNHTHPQKALDEYFATCARGLGNVLAEEIKSPQIDGVVLDIASSGVRFQAKEPGHITGYKACLWLRTAMRVLLHVSSTELHSNQTSTFAYDVTQNVYDFVKHAADWVAMLEGGTKSFSVQVRVSEAPNSRKLSYSRGRRGTQNSGRGRYAQPSPTISPSEHAIQVCVKNAICDAMRDLGVEKPPRPISHAESDVPLFITLHGSSVSLYLDMAGASLHKRGYRSGSMHKSSLNECVAAGMLYMAGFQPDGSFKAHKREDERHGRSRTGLTVVDPMCGSGTILIEAALLRLRVAVGLYRQHFAFQQWTDFDIRTFKQVVDEAVSAQRDDDSIGATFIGNDINPAALAIARRDLERTKLKNIISLHHADATELALPHAPTLTICNPPWGMRLGGEINAWEAMGKFLREYAGGCTAVLLSGDSSVTRGLRMRARQKNAVRIGNVDTRVLIYDVLPKLSATERAERSAKGKINRDTPSDTREHELLGESPVL